MCYLLLEYYHDVFVVLFGLFLCSFFVVVVVVVGGGGGGVFFFFFFLSSLTYLCRI